MLDLEERKLRTLKIFYNLSEPANKLFEKLFGDYHARVYYANTYEELDFIIDYLIYKMNICIEVAKRLKGE